MLGLKPRFAHSAAWKRSDTFALRPSVEVSVARIVLFAQLVGFNQNRGLSIETRTSRTSSGIPCKIVGNGSLTILTVASCLSTNTAARTFTSPRLNGPATAGTMIDAPYGAPLYGPVRYARPFVMKNGFDT